MHIGSTPAIRRSRRRVARLEGTPPETACHCPRYTAPRKREAAQPLRCADLRCALTGQFAPRSSVCSTGHPRSLVHPSSVCSAACRRQRPVEGRAAADRSLSPPPATVTIQDTSDGREPDPRPDKLLLCMKAPERQEDLLCLCGIKTGAVVSDKERG